MKLSRYIICALFVSTQVYAQGIQIVGTFKQEITANHSLYYARTLKPEPKKSAVRLLKLELSPNKQALLQKQLQKSLSPPSMAHKQFSTPQKLPENIQLGMNHVPVLDQGAHGTCVTFAVTAAYDAALRFGDGISQLCQLQLGNYLSANGYTPSGWDGSFGHLILSQMDHFGYVDKAQEAAHGCGGMTEYPLEDENDPASSMTLEDFHQLSTPIDSETVTWSSILNVNDAFEDYHADQIVFDIKTALSKNERVVFGVLLGALEQGFLGAVGTYHQHQDSWILSPDLLRAIVLSPFMGGHEMIITGYDDNAIAYDDDGNAYKGLFTLRNSWGEDVGDQGNFYMSYDYLKTLIWEAARIRSIAQIE
ncbi:MAG: C1 family peptidase [Legionellaceae bacterium]|nr:C1 family peptidase [Legionellaceae bacterium]